MTRQLDDRSLGQIGLRSFQLIFAIVSAALIGADLANWTAMNSRADSRWVYAEVVAAISAFSCLAQWWLALNRAAAAIWDSICFMLWLVVVAVIGQVVFENKPVDGGYSTSRIRAAIGVGICNMLLWLASAAEACICCRFRRQKGSDLSQNTALMGGFESRKPAAVELEPPRYEDRVDLEVDQRAT